MGGKTIGAAQFKMHCLRIIDEVDRSRESVTITKRGRPVAEVHPIGRKKEEVAFGSLKSAVYSFQDPFSPAHDEPWDAEKDAAEDR
jgi:prevent-host-death family protein